MTAALTCPPAAPSRVVLRPAPRREPPFDDELPEGAPGCGSYDQRLPFARVPAPPAWRPRPGAAERPARPRPVGAAAAGRDDRDGRGPAARCTS